MLSGKATTRNVNASFAVARPCCVNCRHTAHMYLTAANLPHAPVAAYSMSDELTQLHIAGVYLQAWAHLSSLIEKLLLHPLQSLALSQRSPHHTVLPALAPALGSLAWSRALPKGGCLGMTDRQTQRVSRVQMLPMTTFTTFSGACLSISFNQVLRPSKKVRLAILYTWEVAVLGTRLMIYVHQQYPVYSTKV